MHATQKTRAYAKNGMAGPPYKEYWSQTLELEPGRQIFKGVFSMQAPEDGSPELAFHLGGNMAKQPEAGEFDSRAPENIAPLVTWLASAESRDITGQVFLVGGGRIGIATPWGRGPGVDHGARWDPAELGAVVPKLVADAG